MSKTQLSMLIASLFIAAPALAQSDDFLFRGSVTAGGIFSEVNDTKDQSKFREFQDLSNGMLSNIGFTGRTSRSWIDAYGENFGRDDQYFSVRGGMYNVFKAQAYTSSMPHNFLFNGLTPFVGSGSGTLRATFPNPDPANWLNVDIGYERKNTGGMIEFQALSPWYFRVDGNQVKTTGTKVGSASNGTSPGNGFVDLAIPVRYETNNASFEGGYTTRTMTFTASYLASNFGNSLDTVSWNNPFFNNGIDKTYLPPSNTYQRFALNGTIRSLPWSSTLAARYTWDQAKSTVNIAASALDTPNTGGTSPFFRPTNPDEATFNGKQERQTFTLGWSGTPMTGLDTRAFYNWQKLDNPSTVVTFNSVGGLLCAGAPCSNEPHLLHSEKHNAGVDAYWRINKANRVGAGYDWSNLKQNREDFDDTTNNVFFVEWKNNSFDNLAARIKYTYLQRRSTFLRSDIGVDANDPEFLARFVRAFDLADINEQKIKLVADWSPMDSVGVAVEYNYKKNDYKDTPLGRKKDTRNEIFANLTYAAPSSWRLSLFGDYEEVKYDSDHRYVGAGTCPAVSATPAPPVTANNCFDPSTAPNRLAYNWSASVKNNNWLLGLGLDVPVGDKLMLTGSLLYEEADGSSDMSAQQNFGNPLPLSNYPNVKTTSLNLKGVYTIDRNWSVTGGYAYQKYEYSDDAFNGYRNTIPYPGVTNNPAQSYLNGWNAYQPYNANIFYLLGTYKF
ncbi:MAG: MtrB/PioB family outer membrane beta-barrel protein [Aromatoleum sp.]|nr:MtrB/PioB family outer membrane beta-barrel protein [Aromatoleum sp.]